MTRSFLAGYLAALGTIVGLLAVAALAFAMPVPAATSKDPSPLIRLGKDARADRVKVRASKCLSRPSYRRPVHQLDGWKRHFHIHMERRRLARDLARPKRCLPTTWPAAVQWAQGPYPGTAGWLLSCSASEGGHGRWVPNRQGSGAGGWLQFMAGTFYANVDRAIGETRARGYRVPSSVRSWYSPLGQAITGASMYRRGLSYHWVGAGC